MKRIISLLLAFCILCNLPTHAFTPASMSIGALPYGANWISGQKADPEEVKGNDNSLRTQLDLVTGTDLLLLPGKADNETITGNWTLNGTTTVGGACTLNGNVTVANNGITGVNWGTDVDNTGAEVNQCFFANRGSTSANDPGICFIAGVAKIVQDKTSLALDKLQVADGASGNDVATYQQTGKLTTTNTWTMVNTFSLAPVSSVAASAANELMRKGEVDAADSAITAGGCTKGASAPVGSCTNGACYWDETDANNPIKWYCNPSMTWVKLDIDTIDSMLALNGNVTLMNGITFDAGNNKLINVLDPTANQDVVTLNYFNTNVPLFGTGSDGAATISVNTTLTSDKYYTNLTINSGSTLTLNGYKIFGTGTLTWNGTIDAGTCSTTSTGSTSCLYGTAGGAGGTVMGNGSPGVAAPETRINNAGGNGAIGGAGGNSTAGTGGAAGNNAGTQRKTVIGDLITAISTAIQGIYAHGPSTGGGGGGANGTDSSTFGGAGGRAGNAAPTALIVFMSITYGASSTAIGIGENGAVGNGCAVGGGGTDAGGGGGGGGGPGALFGVIGATITGNIVTTTLTGGTGGMGAAACATGMAGVDGANGPAGAFVQVDI